MRCNFFKFSSPTCLTVTHHKTRLHVDARLFFSQKLIHAYLIIIQIFNELLCNFSCLRRPWRNFAYHIFSPSSSGTLVFEASFVLHEDIFASSWYEKFFNSLFFFFNRSQFLREKKNRQKRGNEKNFNFIKKKFLLSLCCGFLSLEDFLAFFICVQSFLFLIWIYCNLFCDMDLNEHF